jgi:hypothetical protein
LKLAIAIQSCAAYKERRDAIRKTWLNDVPHGIDKFFFVGSDCDDATKLDCGDTYDDCAEKQYQSMLYLQDYDHIFFCDDDTYVVPDRLLLCGFENHDYMGCPCRIDGDPDAPLMAQGGAGFWLSKKAIKRGLLEERDRRLSPHYNIGKYSDRFVAYLMNCCRISVHGDFRFNLGKYNGDRGFCNLVPNRFNPYITTHFVTPQLADLIYAHFKEGLVLSPNCYTMVLGGKRVDFSEKSGKWWYFVWGDTQFKGEFDLAQHAEMEAFKDITSRV